MFHLIVDVAFGFILTCRTLVKWRKTVAEHHLLIHEKF